MDFPNQSVNLENRWIEEFLMENSPESIKRVQKLQEENLSCDKFCEAQSKSVEFSKKLEICEKVTEKLLMKIRKLEDENKKLINDWECRSKALSNSIDSIKETFQELKEKTAIEDAMKLLEVSTKRNATKIDLYRIKSSVIETKIKKQKEVLVHRQNLQNLLTAADLEVALMKKSENEKLEKEVDQMFYRLKSKSNEMKGKIEVKKENLKKLNDQVKSLEKGAKSSKAKILELQNKCEKIESEIRQKQ